MNAIIFLVERIGNKTAYKRTVFIYLFFVTLSRKSKQLGRNVNCMWSKFFSQSVPYDAGQSLASLLRSIVSIASFSRSYDMLLCSFSTTWQVFINKDSSPEERTTSWCDDSGVTSFFKIWVTFLQLSYLSHWHCRSAFWCNRQTYFPLIAKSVYLR